MTTAIGLLSLFEAASLMFNSRFFGWAIHSPCPRKIAWSAQLLVDQGHNQETPNDRL